MIIKRETIQIGLSLLIMVNTTAMGTMMNTIKTNDTPSSCYSGWNRVFSELEPSVLSDRYEKWEHPNGIRVCLQEFSELKTTTLSIVLRVGRDSESIPGISNLAEHMALPRIKQKWEQNPLLNALHTAGVRCHSETSWSTTSFSFEIQNESLELLLSLLPQLFTDLKWQPDEFREEQEALLSEYGAQVKKPPMQIAEELAFSLNGIGKFNTIQFNKQSPVNTIAINTVLEWMKFHYSTASLSCVCITGTNLDHLRPKLLKLLLNMNPEQRIMNKPCSTLKGTLTPQLIYTPAEIPWFSVHWLSKAITSSPVQVPENILSWVMMRNHANSYGTLLKAMGLIEQLNVETKYQENVGTLLSLRISPTLKGILQWKYLMQTATEAMQSIALSPYFPTIYEQWIQWHKMCFTKGLDSSKSLDTIQNWAKNMFNEPLTSFPLHNQVPQYSLEEAQQQLQKTMQDPPICAVIACPLDVWNILLLQENCNPVERHHLQGIENHSITYLQTPIPSFVPVSLSKDMEILLLPKFIIPKDYQSPECPKTIGVLLPYQEQVLPQSFKIWSQQLEQEENKISHIVVSIATLSPATNQLEEIAKSFLLQALLESRMVALSEEIQCTANRMLHYKTGPNTWTLELSVDNVFFENVLQELVSIISDPLSEAESHRFKAAKETALNALRSLSMIPAKEYAAYKWQELIAGQTYSDHALNNAMSTLCFSDLIKTHHKFTISAATCISAKTSCMQLFKSILLPHLNEQKITLQESITRTAQSNTGSKAICFAYPCGKFSNPRVVARFLILENILNTFFLTVQQSHPSHSPMECSAKIANGYCWIVLQREGPTLNLEEEKLSCIHFLRSFASQITEPMIGELLAEAKKRSQEQLPHSCHEIHPLLSMIGYLQLQQCFDYAFWEKVHIELHNLTAEQLVKFTQEELLIKNCIAMLLE